jgi:predicted DNA-binding transcriptional regulator YafY
VQTQLDVLRHRPAAVVSHSGEADFGSEAATQLGLEALQRAIRLKQRISMNVVDGMGNANLEIVVPLSVSGGRVRVFDPAKDTERVLSIHRIIDIEAAEELRQ